MKFLEKNLAQYLASKGFENTLANQLTALETIATTSKTEDFEHLIDDV